MVFGKASHNNWFNATVKCKQNEYWHTNNFQIEKNFFCETKKSCVGWVFYGAEVKHHCVMLTCWHLFYLIKCCIRVLYGTKIFNKICSRKKVREENVRTEILRKQNLTSVFHTSWKTDRICLKSNIRYDAHTRCAWNSFKWKFFANEISIRKIVFGVKGQRTDKRVVD